MTTLDEAEERTRRAHSAYLSALHVLPHYVEHHLVALDRGGKATQELEELRAAMERLEETKSAWYRAVEHEQAIAEVLRAHRGPLVPVA